jgi:hypothetical protein
VSEPSGSEEAGLPEPLARHLDKVCNQFEVAWRDTTAPRIEEFLVKRKERERSALLRQLRMAIKP